MWVLLLSLIFLAIVALAAGAIQCRKTGRGETGEDVDVSELPSQHPAGCCGQHEVCEKESLLAAVSRDIEYYEDEELDDYRDRSSDSYTVEELEQFQDVLYTMRDEDVAGWVRSLQLRGVALPDELKDEVFMIIGERRQSAV